MCKTKIKIAFFAGALGAMFLFSFCGSARASLITAEKVVELANQERAFQKLPVLAVNDSLVKAAEDKAEDMLKNNYFEHTSPAGLTPWHWLAKNNYEYKYAGENLAMNFLSAESQNKVWMESQTHRANILNTRYQEIGAAVGQGLINGRETIITVQEFGSRADFVPVELKKTEKQQTVPQRQKIVNGEAPRVLADNSLPAPVRFLNDWKDKVVQGNFGIYVMAAAFAGIGYLTVLNFMVLAYLAIESKKKVLQGGKYQVLYTVSAEEYEDLMRNFKARARGMYQAHFDKIHLKMPG